MKKNRDLSRIMKSAWNLAREGAKKFGGKSRTYFACALSMIWAQPDMMSEKPEEPRSVWHPGLGNRYLLCGLSMPSAPMHKGQLGLPGMKY